MTALNISVMRAERTADDELDSQELLSRKTTHRLSARA
jgi:hypothetical protein